MNKEGALSQIEQMDQQFKHIGHNDETVDGTDRPGNTTETVS